MKPATQLLREHSWERRRRRCVASVSLDGQPHASMPRMSEDRWVESLALVAGVPESTLELLEEWHNGVADTHWTTVLLTIRDEEHELRKEQVARPLTLTEAAARVGRPMTYQQARALLRDAVSSVDEKLCARAGREERP